MSSVTGMCCCLLEINFPHTRYLTLFRKNWLTKQIQQEPVLFHGVVQAILALGMSFGLGLNVNQVGTIAAVSAAVLSFIIGRT
jgi:hypothetical protein